MAIVDVLIPLYNCEKTVRRTFASLKNQTFTDFKVIAVDNNCTDSTITIVKEFEQVLDIKVVECKTPGIVPALNTGLKFCESEFVARLDGDDLWHPEKLQKQIDFFSDPKNEKVGVLGTQINLFDEEGNLQSMGTMGKKIEYPDDDDQIKAFLLHGQNPICHPSVMVRNELFLVAGGYEMLYPKAEDLHLWCKLIPQTQFANLKDTLVDYTQRKDDDYDARIPVFIGDVFFNTYKMAGLVTGERQSRIYDWQLDPNHHGNAKR